MRRLPVIGISILILFSACRNQEKSVEHNIARGNHYAEKFSIQKQGAYTILDVYTPWQNGSESVFKYIVAKSNAAIPDSLSDQLIIKAPVKRAVIMSTTFIPFFDTLGEIPSIVGISGGDYIYHPQLRNEIKRGSVRDVGFDNAMNYELLVELNPDVIFLFGVQSGIVQIKNKLNEIGIPVVLCADYLEPHPLGRSEWLNFFSVFFEKEEEANMIFKDIENQYNALAENAKSFSSRPSVLLGLPWKDTWYVAGGKSFASKLISDAGGDYIFQDLQNTEALPYDIEAVFLRALEADYWINPGVASDMNEILEHDIRFENLPAFKYSRVYNNNKRLGPGGGNDYWESGTLRPDILLKDLISIFHDSSHNEPNLYYYKKLE